MARGTSGWDESDVRIRPNKKGSRPRTKDRPAHEDAVTGRIITVDRGRYTAIVDEDTPQERIVTAARARELRRTPVVAGDLVGLVGDVSGSPDSLARLVKVNERATLLRRSADDTDPVERVVVANADQLVIVVAAANPEPRTGFIDRALVAAYDAGISPLLCITKADLKDPADLLANYEHLDLEVVISRTAQADDAGDRLRVRRRPLRPPGRRRRRCPARAPPGQGECPGGPFRRRKVHAGERPHRLTARHRRSERRYRPRPAYLFLRTGAQGAGRAGGQLDHRHARHPLLRAGPC